MNPAAPGTRGLSRLSHRAWGVLAVALALLAYAAAPFGELVWDDPIIFRTQLSAYASLKDVFLPPLDVGQLSADFYRPLVTLSVLLDAALFGSDASAGPHAANLLYHALTTLLVWRLARRLLASPAMTGPATTEPNRTRAVAAAGLAGALFAVHPIHVESVSFVAGRTDVLATLFTVATVVLVLRWQERGGPWSLVLAGICTLLGLLSKEVAVVAPALALGALALGARDLDRVQSLDPSGKPPAGPARGPAASLGDRVLLGICLLLPILVYGALRLAAASTYGGALPGDGAMVLGQLLKAVAWYAGKLLWPWPQSHFVVAEMLPGPTVTAGILLLLVAALVVAAWAWRRGKRLPLYALAWILLSLAPSLVVAARAIAKTPVAERYLYLPSVGLVLLAGTLVLTLLRRPPPLPALSTGIAALLLALGTVATVQRTLVWQTSLSLWSDAARAYPDTAIPWNELGQAHLAAGDLDAAIENYQRALAADGSVELRAIARNNLGVAELRRNNLPAAREAFLAARAESPEFPAPHINLGDLHLALTEEAASRGRPPGEIEALAREALGHYRAGLALNPRQTSARWSAVQILANLGGSAEAAGARARALSHYREALAELAALERYEPDAATRPEVVALRNELRRRLSVAGAAPG